jgi:hypothetical protein
MEITVAIICGILTLSVIKICFTLAAFEERKTHSPYLIEEERHRQTRMMRIHEDPRYFC